MMKWVLQTFISGVFPSERHDGIPFSASPFVGDSARIARAGTALNARAAAVQIRGDWAWMKQAFNLTGWRREGIDKDVCWICSANKTSRDFRRADPEAPWRNERRTHAGFIERTLNTGAFLSGMFDWPGFVLEFVSVDLMHAGDLGVLLYLLGNVYWEFWQYLGGASSNGETPRNREVSAILLHMIKIGAKERGLVMPINQLTLGMIKVDGKNAPKLKVKAAEARKMLEVTHFMLEKLFPMDTSHARMRFQCVSKFVELYRTLENWDPKSSQAQIRRLGSQGVCLYAELSAKAISADPETLLWRMYPKHHLFLHAIEDSVEVGGNPRCQWCYSDEDNIGDAARRAKCCHCNTIHCELIRQYRSCVLYCFAGA